MPETEYVQQAIDTSKKQTQKTDADDAAKVAYDMQRKIMDQIYLSTCSNLGF